MHPVAMSEGFAVDGLHQKELEVIQRKSASTVPLAEGQYGGACSVMMPSRSTRTWRARSEVKIFPRSWKTIAGLPAQGQECWQPAWRTRRSFGSSAIFNKRM